MTAPVLFPNLAAPESVTFAVEGVPEPQGSKSAHSICGQEAQFCRRCRHRHLVKVNMTDDNAAELAEWRKRVAVLARQAYGPRPMMAGAIDLVLIFTADRPPSHYRQGRNAHLLASTAPLYPTGRPDWDKLARAVGDALKGVTWKDDAQVADGQVRLRYTRDCPPVPGQLPVPGVRVTITQLA